MNNEASLDGTQLSSVRGAQNRSPGPNRTPGRYPNPAVPKIALCVLAPRYPERLPVIPPWVWYVLVQEGSYGRHHMRRRTFLYLLFHTDESE